MYENIYILSKYSENMVRVIQLIYEDRIIVVSKSPFAKILAKRWAGIDNEPSKEYLVKLYEELMDNEYDVYNYISNSMNWNDISSHVIGVIRLKKSDEEIFNNGSVLDYKNSDESGLYYSDQ